MLSRDGAASCNELVDVPICIDSSTPEALEAAVPLAQRQGADQLRHRRAALDGPPAAAGRAARRRRDRHGQRRDGHLDGPRGAVRRGAQGRRERREARHRPRGRHHRSARDADRRGARRRHRDVRRTIRRIRDELGVNLSCGASNICFGMPGPPRDRRGVPYADDRRRHEHRDHEPAAPPRQEGDPCRATCCSAATSTAPSGSAITARSWRRRSRLMSTGAGREDRGHLPARAARPFACRAARRCSTPRTGPGCRSSRRAAGAARVASAASRSSRARPSCRSPTTGIWPTGSTTAGGCPANARSTAR